MAKLEKIEDLEMWCASRQLCREIHALIISSPFSTDFALVNQINRSAGSVMDNIAEGFERSGNKELIQFLSIAKGSCGETKSQLYRALDRNYMTQSKFDQLLADCESIGKQINGFIGYLKKSELKGYKFQEPEPEYKKDGESLLFQSPQSSAEGTA